MSSIFLSYSHKDVHIVEKIANDLRKENIEPWLDKKINYGENWVSQIERAITESTFILAFISKNSLQSKWVEKEYLFALGNKIPLIPVLLEKVELPSVLSNKLYVDFTGSYYQGMKSLIRALKTPVAPSAKDIRSPIDTTEVNDLAKEVAGEVAKILGLENSVFPAKSPIKIDPRLVFVIIAFQDDMEPVFEGIKAAGNSVGLDVKRVKDIIGDYRITDQVIHMINSARLIVADLTHERPNVYFELGYARGLGKTVITIARDSTNIHFDVKDWTYLSYTDSRVLERDLKKRFEYELSKIEYS